jgi:hypothetical protein
MRGLVVGDSARNIFQSGAPAAKLSAVARVVHDDFPLAEPCETFRELSHAPGAGVR